MLANLSIRTKQFIAIVPLVIALLFYGLLVIQEKRTIAEDMDRAEATVDLAITMGNLVHALQKERGMSAGFLASKGKKFAAQLSKQRQETDRMLQAFDQELKEIRGDYPNLPAVREYAALLEAVKTQRARLHPCIDTLRCVAPEVVKDYTTLINRLMDIAAQNFAHVSNARILTMGNSYYYLLKFKEQLGLIRATVASAFAVNTTTTESLLRLNTLTTKKQEYLHLFELIAHQEQASALKAILSSPDGQRFEQLLHKTLTQPTQSALNEDPTLWFELATRLINQVKAFENRMEEEIHDHAEAIGERAATTVIIQSVTLIAALLIGLLFSWLIIRGIQRQVQTVATAIEHVSTNADLNYRLPQESHDEMGRISQLLNTLLERMQQLIGDVLHISENVDNASDTLVKAADHTKGSMEQQYEAVQHIYTSIQDMTQAIRDIALQMESVKTQAEDAYREGQQAQHNALDSAQTIQALADRIESTAAVVSQVEKESEQITSVLDIIRDISEQTNLLALNAAIEAARAGEHGRGFAVVADEVRSLAVRTQQSTEEIQKIIESLTTQTSRANSAMHQAQEMAINSVEQMEAIKDTLNGILQAMEATVKANEESARIGQAQAAKAEDARNSADKVQNLAEAAQRNTEEVYTASHHLKKLAETLKSKARLFKI